MTVRFPKLDLKGESQSLVRERATVRQFANAVREIASRSKTLIDLPGRSEPRIREVDQFLLLGEYNAYDINIQRITGLILYLNV